jgi:hypothetical protein
LREVECSVAPVGLDLALCHVADPVTGIAFERLGVVPADSTTLQLTGFGCTSFLGDDGEFMLNKRSVEIKGLSGESALIELDQPLLCPGDSGGPGYVLLSNDPAGPRLVVGVNGERISLTRVFAPAAREFIRGWTDRTGAQICGFTAGTQGCRD